MTTSDGSRLMNVLATRGGLAYETSNGHGPRAGEATGTASGGMVLQHREALVYTLGKAAALEHLVMCQYLYAAFSMKDREDDGLAPEQLEAVRRWRREILHIAEQEMLHLALVQNVLTAVGAAPAFGRPNFPLPVHAYPAGIQMALLPFGETSLRHFAFLERPEGLDVADAEAFAALDKSAPLPSADEEEIGPRMQDFPTIGALYRAVEAGLGRLTEKLGEATLFLGPPAAQATEAHFRWPELIAVTDVASASAAIQTIVEQGEGARGDWKNAHFGRLIAILDEYLAMKAADPGFEPARPVLAACVREREDGLAVPIVREPFANRVTDLLNAVYELLLQLLARYFAHTEETEEQLATLADVAVSLMYAVVKPLGGLVTRLPVGPEHPGATVGPTFELFYQVDYLLPHREAAWAVIEERMRDVAGLAVMCRESCSPLFMPPLIKVTDALKAQADRLHAAR
ncbi:MAG TPA: ferritin-like protein [Candidatus Limnocylindrales bacterium]|nr:ferritin-like protein [Candidatus Limnocylindrales bacterium]